MGYDVVERIICDDCGYLDLHNKFPDYMTPEFEIVMRKFDQTGPWFSGGGVGIICPKCGNYSEFDFNPPEDLDTTPLPCSKILFQKIVDIDANNKPIKN